MSLRDGTLNITYPGKANEKWHPALYVSPSLMNLIVGGLPSAYGATIQLRI